MDAATNAKRMGSMMHVLAWLHSPADLEASSLGLSERAAYPVEYAPTDETLAAMAAYLFPSVVRIETEKDAKIFLARLFFVHGMDVSTGFDPAKSFQGYVEAGGEWMYDPVTAQRLSETLATGRLSVGLARLYELTTDLMCEMHMIR